MRDAALQERRNRQILADIVRTYIETGEPVSSRAISKRFEETLSTATIRNVMADLEDGGLLVPAAYFGGASAYRGGVSIFCAGDCFASHVEHRGSRLDYAGVQRGVQFGGNDRARRDMCWRKCPAGWELSCRRRWAKLCWSTRRMWLLPDGRVVVVLISPGGVTRDKILRPHRHFSQPELDRIAEFLNQHYSGWTLEAIRGDLLQKLANERERYEGIVQSALTLCDPAVLGEDNALQRSRGRHGADDRRDGICRPGAVARFAGRD